VTIDARVPEGAGLTTEEAARRLLLDGENTVPRARPRSLLRRVTLQFVDPMILLLCGAAAVVVALGDIVDASIIVAVIVVNASIGVFQEMRAESAIAALDRMAAPTAHVRRDGRFVQVPAAELVVGDEVRLEAGDVVPADLELIESAAFEVDEASMTGESEPVSRTAGDGLLSGTVVTRGRALATTVRTGSASGLGRIAEIIATTGVRPTPLQRRLSRLSGQLVLLTSGLVLLVLVLSVARGAAVADSLILAVSLGVAAIPESLPAVVSVALALGAFRMARSSAVVRWLPAVETLGSVSVLASDKTGTLTEGRMTVRRLWTTDGPCEVFGPPYARDGDLRGDGLTGDGLSRLLRDVVLCNDARLNADGATWSVIGDPMEGALLVAAARLDEQLLALPETWRRVSETPFDSARRSMTTVHAGPGGRRTEVIKGAPEVVLDLLPSSPVIARARAEARKLAADGYRVIAVADSSRGSGEPLELAGLVGIADPPREDAADVVAACRAAGIRPILITGDHPATALAVAQQVGIARPGSEVADGEMVARGDHRQRVETIDVYARTHPEQKVDIVEAWRARGHVVAMTGDGVNDAPALRRADIGVAMGDRGTEVARQAADLVLADDDLRTVVTAVGEGRRIYANIRTFLRYGMSGGLAEVLVILVAPFLGMAAPLLPGQILWINMLTHGIPGVAFGNEPLDPRLMERPSPSPERSVLGDGLIARILSGGALIAAASLAAGLLALEYDWHLSTTVFVTLGVAQLGLALALRAPRSQRGLGERALEISVLGAVALQVLAVTWSPIQELLGTRALDPTAWFVAMTLALVPGAVVGISTRLRRGAERGSA
jgi:Ca2+-transporting ATPase